MKRIGSVLGSLAIVGMMTGVCVAQQGASGTEGSGWQRNGVDFYLLAEQLNGGETSFSEGGVTVDLEMDDTIAYGLGGATRWDYVGLCGNVFLASTEITGSGVGRSIPVDTLVFGAELNVEFSLLKTRVTPVVGGGVGYLGFSSDDEQVVANETDFSYNVGAGLRWDIAEGFFASAIYKTTWTTLQDTDDAMELTGFCFALGYMMPGNR